MAPDDSALPRLLREWEAWSTDAVKDHDGWQSSFPDWRDLMAAVGIAMERFKADPSTYREIERCWELSEETEDLADVAREDARRFLPVLERLSTASSSAVRWQVYDVLGESAGLGDAILRRGLRDPHPYARRRAVLALARERPDDAAALAHEFAQSEDPYLRLASLSMAAAAHDKAMLETVAALLANDPAPFVADEARARLRRR